MLHHTKNIPGFGFSGGWDDFVALFLRGKVESSSIWPWHRGWWEAAAAHPSTVLVVHFEDLKRDLKAAVGRVAAHLGGLVPLEGDAGRAGDILVEQPRKSRMWGLFCIRRLLRLAGDGVVRPCLPRGRHPLRCCCSVVDRRPINCFR